MRNSQVFKGLVFFSLLLTITCKVQQSQVIVVAKDGSGNFKSVSAAVGSISPKIGQTTIKIMPGVYYERVNISADLKQVLFLGTNPSTTLIIHDTPGAVVGTFSSWTVIVESDNFIAEGISFANNASNYDHTKAGQSVALDIRGDKATLRNCHLLGAQDTLYTGKERNYFQNCFINGSVDSIFGEGSAVFEDCIIEITDYVTAHKGIEGSATKYLLSNCTIRRPSNRSYVKQGTYLGRPWGCWAWVIYKQCDLGDLINPAGWWDWNKNASCLATVNYDEWRNNGPGSSTNSRVSWSHQLSDQDAAKYTTQTVLNGWIPPPPIS